MPLHLKIENETSLPDGGPISCTVTSKRGIDIGRDQYLDWVLPDPTRFISGKHCEVRFRDGQYWLTDVSTNGTFVNRSEFRLDRPHALQTGDRVEIGRFIISVVVEPEAGAAFDAPDAGELGGGSAESGLWTPGGQAAPAINPRELRTSSVSSGINSFDVLDWAADIPTPTASAQPMPATPAAPAPSGGDDSWILASSAMPAPRTPRAAQPPQDMPPPAPAPEPPAAQQAAPATDSFFWDIEKLPAPQAAPAAAQAAPVQTAPPPPAPPAPQPEQQPEPAPVPQAAPRRRAGDSSDVLRRFAKGAGLPPESLAHRDEGDLAELLGVMVRTVAENLRQLHMARAQSKGMMRSANQTMIQALDNNPLRFSPTTDDALRIMFGPRTTSYLDPHRTLESSFSDLKKHQLMTFSAMQAAVARLLEDIDPKKIDDAIEQENGLSALLSSRKSKLWDHFITVWNAKSGKNEQGMLGVFMLLFAEAYDRQG